MIYLNATDVAVAIGKHTYKDQKSFILEKAKETYREKYEESKRNVGMEKIREKDEIVKDMKIKLQNKIDKIIIKESCIDRDSEKEKVVDIGKKIYEDNLLRDVQNNAIAEVQSITKNAKSIFEATNKISDLKNYIESLNMSKTADINTFKSVDTGISKSIDTDISRSIDTSIPRSIDTDIPRSIDVDLLKSVGTDMSKSIDTEKSNSIDVDRSKNTDIGRSRNTDIDISKTVNINVFKKYKKDLLPKVDAVLVDLKSKCEEIDKVVSSAISSEINTSRGMRDENIALDIVAKNTGKIVKDSNSKVYYKKLYLGSSVLKIGGRVDGWLNEDTITEVKNRQRKLFKKIPLYEKIQIQVYLQLTGASKCHFLEKYKDQTWSVVVCRNQDFWDKTIVPGLRSFCEQLATFALRSQS